MDSLFEIVQQKTDDELLKMVYEFESWSPEMLTATEAELAKRNILPEDIALKRQERITNEDAELSKGKEASMVGFIIGWLGVLGLLGMIIGYTYSFSKTRSKYTGKVYFKYDQATREMGSYIFYTSVVVFIAFIFFKIATMY